MFIWVSSVSKVPGHCRYSINAWKVKAKYAMGLLRGNNQIRWNNQKRPGGDGRRGRMLADGDGGKKALEAEKKV